MAEKRNISQNNLFSLFSEKQNILTINVLIFINTLTCKTFKCI